MSSPFLWIEARSSKYTVSSESILCRGLFDQEIAKRMTDVPVVGFISTAQSLFYLKFHCPRSVTLLTYCSFYRQTDRLVPAR